MLAFKSQIMKIKGETERDRAYILTTPSSVSSSEEFLRNFANTVAKRSTEAGSTPGTSFKSLRISAMSVSVKYSPDSLLEESPVGAPKHTYQK